MSKQNLIKIFFKLDDVDRMNSFAIEVGQIAFRLIIGLQGRGDIEVLIKANPYLLDGIANRLINLYHTRSTKLKAVQDSKHMDDLKEQVKKLIVLTYDDLVYSYDPSDIYQYGTVDIIMNRDGSNNIGFFINTWVDGRHFIDSNTCFTYGGYIDNIKNNILEGRYLE